MNWEEVDKDIDEALTAFIKCVKAAEEAHECAVTAGELALEAANEAHITAEYVRKFTKKLLLTEDGAI